MTTESTPTVDPRETPQPISAATWDAQLNMLPPLDWRREAGAESFTCMEPYDQTRHWRFVRIGEQHWKVLASRRVSIPELAARCRAVPFVDPTEAALCAELEAYCTQHGLPLHSADALVHGLDEDGLAKHGAWLAHFIDRWEAWEDRQHAEAR